MSTIFLVTMPRSGGAALAAMLGAESADCQAAVVAKLPPEQLAAKTWRLTHSGHGIWNHAVAEWSRLLAIPDARIIFLTRQADPEGQYEMSLVASIGQWVPFYGKCYGCVFNATRSQRNFMGDFHVMNPSRTILLDHVELEDYPAFAAKLGDLAPAEEKWREQAELRPRSRKSLPPPSEPIMAPEDYDGDIPYGFFEQKAKDAVANGMQEMFDDVPEGFFEQKAKDAAAPDYDWEKERDERMAAPELLRLPLPRNGARTPKVEVHTIRYGDEPWLRECSDSLDRWAFRHGWSVREWGENPAYPHPKFCQVDMLREFLAGDNDWLIYVDGDVFVHPAAPEFPLRAGFSIMEDPPFATGKHLVRWVNWCYERFPDLKLNGWRYRNAGVWACDRDAAARLLEVVREPYHTGPTMEQNHWNAWLVEAWRKGLRVRDLPLPWNSYASLNKAAWFHHLAGRGSKNKKLKRLRALNLLPSAPESFRETPSTGPRAICYLWHAGQAVWEELRYSLRSVEKHFEPEVPIHIFATERPPWLAEHPRITIHLTGGYPESLAAALQIADEVVLMNDDICFLKPVAWDDLTTALFRRGDLLARMPRNLGARNAWLRGVGRATLSLLHAGHDSLRDFSTHTPYLFERRKSMETLRRHGVWRKMPFETLYYNDHGTVSEHTGRRKTMRLPIKGDPAFLNYGAPGPKDPTKRALMARFPEPAPWEQDPGPPAVVWLAVGGALPHLPEFREHNPGVEVFTDDAPVLTGEDLKYAWRNGDRRILEWWGKNRDTVKAGRVLFLEWDVRFAAPVAEVFRGHADFLCAGIKEPGSVWQWWGDARLLPDGFKEHLVGASPLSVLLLSRRALDAMWRHQKRAPLLEADIFCELRLPTLAAAVGYPPVAHPALRNVHYKDCDPTQPIAHPVK